MAVRPQRGLLRELWALSRFDRYNPLFTVFAGAWSTLLSGAVLLGEKDPAISSARVFQQTAMGIIATYLFCGFGMVWNDWIDRDIDAQVARTKHRPLAAGAVTTTQAMVWMMLQITLSWGLVHVLLDGKDVWKHWAPLIIATILYPFGKRQLARKLMVYPQYILAFVIAWPAIPGRAAIHGPYESFTTTALKCLPLCIMVFFWTIYLNTAYSYQDVVDDRKLKVNSFYNIAGEHIKVLLFLLAAPILVCLPFYLADFDSVWLWVSWMGVWAVTLVKQLVGFNPKQPASGGVLHKSNFNIGIWTMLACAVEVFLKASRA